MKLAGRRFVIRADASVNMGIGHVMRCLTLADVLRDKGANVAFISQELPGDLCGFVSEKGFEVHRLPAPERADLERYGNGDDGIEDNWKTSTEHAEAVLAREGNPADFLIVDHYASTREWESRLRSYTKRIMVIDDLANRPHDCDLLLDQNLSGDAERSYDSLVPSQCRKLIGPRYAILRREFYEMRKKMRKRDAAVRRILIFFGGSDPTNETEKAVEAIRLLNTPDVQADVVIGSANRHRERIERLCAAIPNTNTYFQVSNMAELIMNADLAIGAGGSTTWERCCLGLPALVTILAENQECLTKAVASRGAIVNMGWAKPLSPTDYKQAISAIGTRRLHDMSQRGLELVDGEGCSRVSGVIGNMIRGRRGQIYGSC